MLDIRKTGASSNNAFGESISLLWTRRFGTFWFASLLSNIGTWAQQVAQPWLLLSLGASSFLIGLDTFALGAPVLLLTLVGGVLADRADRRRVIAKFQSIQMLCPTLLVVLLLAGMVRPWMVIVLSLVVGITDALSMPSFQSIVPSIVERKQIASGLALNSTQFNLSRILGPAIAGILLVSVGAVGCFAVSAASYVPFIVVALWILPRRVTTPTADAAYDRRHIFANVLEIARIPHLRGALLTVFLTSLLCAPLVTFSPVLVKDAFHGDASHFSIAVGAFGVGGLLGAIMLLFVDVDYDRRYLCSWFAGVYGVVLVLVALNPWFWGLPTLLVVGGMAMSVSNISANTLLQANTTSQLRGQTVSLYMLAMRGGLSIGSLLTGISVSLLGVNHALLINGALAVVAQLVVGRKWFRSPLPKGV
jgi:MFS family permease